MQSIVSKGKDVNQAIQLGLDLLEATKNEVNIEIIQHESRGFLRIGSREAIVKLTKIESSSSLKRNEENVGDPLQFVEDFVSGTPNEKMEQIESIFSNEQEEMGNKFTILENESLAGKAWVKDGKLYCQSSPTYFPTITIHDGIVLYKNNQRVKEKTIIISENDKYEIKTENVEKETKWKVSMDQHKLKVFLYVEPGYRIIRKILDTEPAHHIHLTVEEKKEIINSLTYSEIMKELEALKVIHGFNQEEILKAIEAKEPCTLEVASGIHAKPGKDGWIELLVDIDTLDGPKEKEDGRVDFREIKSIPAVERGKVIAIVHPPIPGKIGYTVTNEPLPPKKSYPVVVKARKGIMVVDDKIVATENGRPHIEQRGNIVNVSIMQKHTHPGNVDMSSGNIRFMGDVEILGEVESNMLVEADGDITVHQTVSMAKLTASGAIVTFGNIIGSEISAGKNNMLVAELGHLLGIMNQHLEKMIELIKQLTLTPGFKSSDFSRGGLQPLIRILLERKFKNFPPLAKKYVEVVRRGEKYLADEAWREVSDSISQLFLSLSNKATSINQFIHLSKKMKELHEMSNTPVEPDSYITIPYALNSRLYCSGNILILGQGCFNTKIHSGGMVKINGILRGGEVYGRLGVEVNEAGSEGGISTIIAVPDDQIIYIKKAMEGTSIKIGNLKHTFNQTTYNVRARLNNDGRIVFEKWGKYNDYFFNE
ncbi:flagellar assembly protein A [Peribacillus tepidiphilus]|uniref:flagellar assembly protein A n=1 Tax=Peribacillus tepidiphilus TaxID=2652445 RepID=UPI0035B50584